MPKQTNPLPLLGRRVIRRRRHWPQRRLGPAHRRLGHDGWLWFRRRRRHHRWRGHHRRLWHDGRRGKGCSRRQAEVGRDRSIWRCHDHGSRCPERRRWCHNRRWRCPERRRRCHNRRWRCPERRRWCHNRRWRGHEHGWRGHSRWWGSHDSSGVRRSLRVNSRSTHHRQRREEKVLFHNGSRSLHYSIASKMPRPRRARPGSLRQRQAAWNERVASRPAAGRG